MVRIFIGRVETIEDNQIITFSFTDIQDSMSPFPSASPMTKLTRYPEVGDEVIILQPDKDFEVFVYTITPDDKFDISLQYGNSYVKISKKSNDDTFPIDIKSDTSVTVNVNGKSTITADSKGTSLNVEGSTVNISKDKVETMVGGNSMVQTSNKLTIFGQVEVTP